MKKIFTILIALLAVVGGAQAQTGITLTFSKDGTPAIAADGTVSGISVNVSAVDGTTDISGVTATVNKVYFSEVNAFQGDNVCSNYTILGPDDDFGNVEGSYGNYYITISGLKNVLSTFNKITLGVEALNITGLYQGNYSSPTFSATVSTATSISKNAPKAEADSTTFGTQSSIALAYENGSTQTATNNSTPNKKTIEFLNATGITVDDNDIILIVNVKKTNGKGCFFGLEDIKLTYEPLTYKLTTIGAPSGATYSYDSKEIVDNSFTAYKSELNGNSVSVNYPEGITGYNVLSQTHTESGSTGTYTITFTYNGTVDLSTYTSGNYKATFSDPASSIEAGKWYLLCQDRDGDGFVNRNTGDNKYHKDWVSNFTTGTTLSTSNEVYLFRFVPTTTDDVYYIQNADGSFFGEGTGDGHIPAATTGYPYTVKISGTANNITYFYMQCTTTGYIVDNNGNSNPLSWWKKVVPSGTSGNNVWRFYEVTFEDLATYAREALNAEISKAEKISFGSNIGQYPTNADAEQTIKDAIATAKNVSEDNTKTAADLETATTTLNTTIKTACANLSLNIPTVDAAKFFKLKNYNTQGYLTSPACGNTSAPTAQTEDSGNATIWYYCTGSNGKKQLQSYYSGEFINGNNDTPNMSTTPINSTGDGFTFENNTGNYVGTVHCFGKSSGWHYLKSATANTTISTKKDIPTSAEAAWYVEQVEELPVTMHSITKDETTTYYATVYVPTPVTVNGATPYYVSDLTDDYATNTNGGYATLSTFENNIIPANTAAILIGGSETVSLNVSENAGTSVENPLLKGSFTAVQPSADNYYFGRKKQDETDENSDYVAGFYLVNNIPSTLYVSNIAWIVAGAAPAKGFTFVLGDDDPTGISSATATDEILENSVRYNLQGQRVDEGYKGIVIIGGKKYLIK